jgi:hypothetical protein
LGLDLADVSSGRIGHMIIFFDVSWIDRKQWERSRIGWIWKLRSSCFNWLRIQGTVCDLHIFRLIFSQFYGIQTLNGSG